MEIEDSRTLLSRGTHEAFDRIQLRRSHASMHGAPAMLRAFPCLTTWHFQFLRSNLIRKRVLNGCTQNVAARMYFN
jgi:hypothetical protein